MTNEVAPSKPIRRRQFIELCAGSLALAAAGCSPRKDRARTEYSTITVLYPTEELWYLPAQFLLFLPLVARSATGEVEGRLARSWRHSPDYYSWTIDLQPNVRWHDGVPVTAHDVKFSLDLFAHPALNLEAPDTYTVEVLDDHTYTITFHKRPVGYWDDYIVYYPRHLLEKLDPAKFYQWDFWQHPVGNGPYRYVRHVPKTMLELEANADYYRGKPRIDRVILKFGPPALTELLSGNVDVIPWVREMDLLKIAGDPRFRVYSTVEPEHIRTIVWNQHNQLFREAKVRSALTLAINRRELHRVLNLPKETPVFDVIFTRPQFRRGQLPSALPYDPELAKKLLDQAGWRASHSDGVRNQGGKPFRFTAVASLEEDLDKAAVYIQERLRRVGIEMDITALEAGAARARLRAGDFDAAVAVVDEDLDAHTAWFGETSRIGYRNRDVAGLLKQAAGTLNPDEADRIYGKLMPIFQEDLPVTFLYPLVRTTVAHRRVRGMSSPYREDPVWYMDELWLEEEG